MGLFTTEDMKEGEDFLSDYDGPSIPVFDYRPTWLNVDELAEVRSRWIRFFGDYWWGRGMPDHTRYDADKVMDFQITFGALPNHHCKLNTISYKYRPPGYDDTLVDSLASPGIGAMSYHNGRNFFVKVRTVAPSSIASLDLCSDVATHELTQVFETNSSSVISQQVRSCF
jgi:hypothetical protein